MMSLDRKQILETIQQKINQQMAGEAVPQDEYSQQIIELAGEGIDLEDMAIAAVGAINVCAWQENVRCRRILEAMRSEYPYNMGIEDAIERIRKR